MLITCRCYSSRISKTGGGEAISLKNTTVFAWIIGRDIASHAIIHFDVGSHCPSFPYPPSRYHSEYGEYVPRYFIKSDHFYRVRYARYWFSGDKIGASLADQIDFARSSLEPSLCRFFPNGKLISHAREFTDVSLARFWSEMCTLFEIFITYLHRTSIFNSSRVVRKVSTSFPTLHRRRKQRHNQPLSSHYSVSRFFFFHL